MLDQAIEALGSYDWGKDYAAIKPIEEAVVSTEGDAEARKTLEENLAGILSTGASRAAKDYVCRQLRIIGTAMSVPAAAKLLTDKELSHMARYALESNPTPEAGAALREALANVEGPLLIGIISTLGDRKDNESVDSLALLLNHSDANVVRAAATALGNIRTIEASQVLARCDSTDPVVVSAVIDASLCCAESFLDSGNKAAALLIYKRYSSAPQKHVQLAAKRGMLSALGE